MKARRAEEDVDYYVDRYETKNFVLVCGILILCVLDAYLTLRILRFGGIERNPFLLIFLNRMPTLGMIVKYLGTTVCVVALLIHKNFIVFGVLRVQYLLYVIFLIYCILVSYEASLVFNHAKIFGPMA